MSAVPNLVWEGQEIAPASVYFASRDMTMRKATLAAKAAGQRFVYATPQKPKGKHPTLFLCIGSRAYAEAEYAAKKRWDCAHMKARYSDPRYRIKHLLRTIRVRAAEEGVPFSLEEDVVVAKIMAGRCEVTGVSFDLSRLRCAVSPSIDRIVAGKGYTAENTQVVCLAYNFMKNSFPEQEVAAFLAAVVRQEAVA